MIQSAMSQNSPEALVIGCKLPMTLISFVLPKLTCAIRFCEDDNVTNVEGRIAADADDIFDSDD